MRKSDYNSLADAYQLINENNASQNRLMKTAEEWSEEFGKTAVGYPKAPPEIIAQIQKEAYNQALLDVKEHLIKRGLKQSIKVVDSLIK